MSKKKFKVGDRVRFIGDYTHYVEEALKNGEVYIVSNVDDWGVELSVPMESHVDTEYIELAEPTDSRTAFLQELKELLARYNAEILAVKWAKDATTIKPLLQIDVDGHKQEPLVWENMLHNDYAYLNADNIMDYQ